MEKIEIEDSERRNDTYVVTRNKLHELQWNEHKYCRN